MIFKTSVTRFCWVPVTYDYLLSNDSMRPFDVLIPRLVFEDKYLSLIWLLFRLTFSHEFRDTWSYFIRNNHWTVNRSISLHTKRKQGVFFWLVSLSSSILLTTIYRERERNACQTRQVEQIHQRIFFFFLLINERL